MDQPLHIPVGPQSRSSVNGTQNKADGVAENSDTRIDSIRIPGISLPQGGGALKGIDEKFEVNAVNGTAGCSIPIPITPGRNNFSPELTLSYNSGTGNGAFGLGWSLGLPSIQRKTDRKIPQYRESPDEDVFMFSGAEDLVSFLEEDPINGRFKERKSVTSDGYSVNCYRPRLEGRFDRIEKIHHNSHGVYWKVTTGSNVATLFGRDPKARIADPQDPFRIFKWLPEFSYDDKGNWIRFHYKKDSNIKDDRTLLRDDSIPNTVYEKNRKSGLAPYTNTYLKGLTYGNRSPYYADPARPYDPQTPENEEYFFELVLDYGEHDELIPTPQEDANWNYREDAFSSYRSGFEIRTNRLCRRMLMFHHFKEEKQFVNTPEETEFGVDYLVRSLDLEYESSSINHFGQCEVTYLSSIVQSGYIRKPDNSYSRKSLPPMEFTYEKLNWNKQIKTVSEENIANAPVGLSNNYQWVDLYGEGISGILSEQGENWYYKSNLGDFRKKGEVEFTVAQKVTPKPSFTGLSQGVLSLQDLEANGAKQVVVTTKGMNGYFELADDTDWKPFRHFESKANVDLQNPNTRLIDLNGDGQPDLLITEDNVFVWHTSDGKKGYRSTQVISKSIDEEQGPAIVFADSNQSIFLADMCGDGLTDIVRIRNGEVCYWANMGYGRFSAKITMDNAPWMDYSDSFHPKYLHLADVSGTGASDLIYLGENKFTAFINLSGNAWSEAHEIESFPPVDRNTKLSVIDLLGTGTSCIVWSSDLPSHANAPMKYIDLMNSQKPHVLVHYINNMGKETSMEYKSSTQFYLKDKLEGKPWITKLPFPVQVIQKMIVEEKISGVRFTSEYSYHHGYYDYKEKEFRGFGRVDQLDTEFYSDWKADNTGNLPIAIGMESSEELYQPPVLTKTWYHTGAFFDRDKILSQFKKEYWPEEFNRSFPASKLTVSEVQLEEAKLFPALSLQDSSIVDNLSTEEWQEALRACKGMVLRQEVFALDGQDDDTTSMQKQAKPYSVATRNGHIQLLQPRKNNSFAVFMVTESEAISIQYERDDADPRIAHTLHTKMDDLGRVLEAASVVYPRKKINMELPPEIREKQAQTLITITRTGFTNDIKQPQVHRIGTASDVATFEITGLTSTNSIFEPEDFEKILTSASTEIAYHEQATPGQVERRLIEYIQTLYYRDDLTGPLPFGVLESCGMSYEGYQLALTPELLKDIFGDKITNADDLMDEGRYVKKDGNWWVRSGTVQLIDTEKEESLTDAQSRFYSPLFYTDPFGSITSTTYYKDYYLMTQSTTDAIGNQMNVEHFNFRILSPILMKDINDNLSGVLLDETGLVKATAVMGTGDEADNLHDLREITSETEAALIKEYFTLSDTADLRNTARELLQNATGRFVYDFHRYRTSVTLRKEQMADDPDTSPCATVKLLPAVVGGITREEHHQENPDSPLQLGFEYSDGMGHVAMVKSQAEPGKALQLNIQPDCIYTLETVDTAATGQLRWIGNGRTVLNNKGNPVKQYEPYFSVNPFYEDARELVERGITPIIYYDAMGRNVRTELPDGTFTKVEFDAWSQRSYDANDTVMDSRWYKDRNSPDPDEPAPNDPQKLAAWKAAQHYNTPSVVHLDNLGRPVLGIAHNRINGTDEIYHTITHVDIENNVRSIIDARGNTVMTYKYDLLGGQLYQNSMDAGESWILGNVVGNPLRVWDSRGHIFSTIYDAVQRPLELSVRGGDGSNPLDLTYSKTLYGEGLPNDKQKNFRGVAIEQYDTAGKVAIERIDFKGNILESTRRLNRDYKTIPNWDGNNIDELLESESFSSTFTYDALNRVIKVTTPDGSVHQPTYNEAGMMEQVKVLLPEAGGGSGEGNEKIFVKNISYDEKGQRKSIIYGNDVKTTYEYDPINFRLVHLQSRKQNNELLQDLYYTNDPVGNISEIENRAIPTIFFGNHKIDPKSEFIYDALYRLIQAKGREHAGQNSIGNDDNWNDQAFLKQYSPNDPMAWRNYTQSYQYDGAGNILQMRHQAGVGSWTRNYQYETLNNRLMSTSVGNQTFQYPHQTDHGFITQLPHLSVMQWNFKDELQATARQVVNNGTPETTWYVYDGSGQRIRKITEKEGGTTRKDERIYLGGVEIYRKYSGTSAGLERTTLHVMDDQSRIAMVDTRNEVDDGTEHRTVRYQLSNHLGSAALEVTGDSNAKVISYEEYHPFGTTSYQAVNASIKTAAKRYRYTGMERDEETGMGYHSARYYLPWLGRWLSADPGGISGGINLYSYAFNNPVMLVDSEGNTPKPGTVDYQIMTMTDAQLIGHLKSIDKYQRGAMAMSATGMFKTRVEAARTLVGLEAVYTLKEVKIEGQPPEETPVQVKNEYLPSFTFRPKLGEGIYGEAVPCQAMHCHQPGIMNAGQGPSLGDVGVFLAQSLIVEPVEAVFGDNTTNAPTPEDVESGNIINSTTETEKIKDSAIFFALWYAPKLIPKSKGTEAIISDDTITLYHGSIDNATSIKTKGLDPSKGSTFTTTDKAAALDAISNPNRLQFVDDINALDRGIIESNIPASEFSKLPLPREYKGFHGAGLESTEVVLRTEEHILLFNEYIVK